MLEHSCHINKSDKLPFHLVHITIDNSIPLTHSGTPLLSSCVLCCRQLRHAPLRIRCPARRIVSGNYFAVSCQSTCESPQLPAPTTAWRFSFALCIPSSSDLANRQSAAFSPARSPFLSLSLCPFVHPATSAENPSKRMLMHVGSPTPTSAAPFTSFHSIPFHTVPLRSAPFCFRIELTLRILNYCVHMKIGQTLIIYLFKWSWAKLLQTESPFQALCPQPCRLRQPVASLQGCWRISRCF